MVMLGERLMTELVTVLRLLAFDVRGLVRPFI